jgi:MoxR-like ATPase
MNEPTPAAVVPVGRAREQEQIRAALAGRRHLVLEGPPGTGKSTLLRHVAQATGRAVVFVEGNAELTPARLIGTFDPAAVLDRGYQSESWLDGPLATALRDGSLLYIEELNRVPEETLNVIITVMSEGELHVPRLGHLVAAESFGIVAAMNPFDAVGTARISSAVSDRCCRLAMGYQSAVDETAVVRAVATGAAATVGNAVVDGGVAMVRDSRAHPEIRVGSSVRGAIDFTILCAELAAIRSVSADDPSVTLDAALLALSGRVRLHESSAATGDDIVRELWARHFGPAATAPSPTGDAGHAEAHPKA